MSQDTKRRVLLIRHGRTTWNDAARIQGQTDIGLSAAGRDEVSARRIPADYASLNWYASPLARATETARLLGARELALDDRLMEMNWGDWEGSTRAQLSRDLGEGMRNMEKRGLDFRPPAGESPRELGARLLAWLDDLARTRADAIAVTHKGVIKAALGLATDWNLTGKSPIRLNWKCAHLFSYAADDRRLHVECMNVKLERSCR